MTNEQWDNIWFVSRVLVGMILQLFLLLCAVALAEVAVEVALELPDIKRWRVLAAAMAGLSAFISGMAGARWVKEHYVALFLSDVLDKNE